MPSETVLQVPTLRSNRAASKRKSSKRKRAGTYRRQRQKTQSQNQMLGHKERGKCVKVGREQVQATSAKGTASAARRQDVTCARVQKTQ
jgi:hypothetical protein